MQEMQEIQETQLQSLSQEDPLEQEMATHSIILAWKIPRTGELVGYSPQGLKDLDMTELDLKSYIGGRNQCLPSSLSLASFHITAESLAPPMGVHSKSRLGVSMRRWEGLLISLVDVCLQLIGWLPFVSVSAGRKEWEQGRNKGMERRQNFLQNKEVLVKLSQVCAILGILCWKGEWQQEARVWGWVLQNTQTNSTYMRHLK